MLFLYHSASGRNGFVSIHLKLVQSETPAFLLTQAFMFESSLSMAVTKWGESVCDKLDLDYYKCWQAMAKNFDLSWKPVKQE